MKMHPLSPVGLALLVALQLVAASCNSSSKQSGSGNGASSGTSTDATGSPAISNPTTGASVDNITATNYPDGYYTGYDGTDAFAILVAGYGGQQTYSIADTSVASIQTVTVTVPSATLTQLSTALTSAGIDSTTLGHIIDGFGHQRSMYKITPLKAGNTTITATAASGASGGGGPGPGGPGGDNGFQSGSTDQVLVVADYTTAQFAAGKARYATDHDADDPACGSCHLTGKDGAPPHALGDVNRIPDVAAEQWVTTGVLGSRKASIPHAWKFANQDEELGTVAYVRSLEASDPEQLVLLEFAQHVSGCGITLTIASDGTISAKKASTTTTTGCFGPPGAATSTSTSTSTATATSTTSG